MMVEYILQVAFYIKYTTQLVCLEKTGHKTNDLLKQKPKLQIKSFAMQKNKLASSVKDALSDLGKR